MEMLAVTLDKFSDPSGYQLAAVPRPVISEPTDIIIRVHAASVNPIDVKKASGQLKAALHENFPYRLGFDCAGVVQEVGTGVTKFKSGDEVYVRLPETYRGSWAEYAVCAEKYLGLKPKSISFAEAASIPLAAMTALQAMKRYRGSLEGKTVLVPGGLSGTGAYACQLAKNVFKAGKVITTVSTAKVPQVDKLLGKGVVDQIIDYTKIAPESIIPRGSIDFLLDTTGDAMKYLSLMVPKTSLIMSISTMPSAAQMQNSDMMSRPDKPRIPMVVGFVLNAMDTIRRLRAWRWSVEYSYMFLGTNAEDLALLTKAVDEKKLVPVVGSTAQLHNLEAVRKLCQPVYDGKGGTGKAIITCS